MQSWPKHPGEPVFFKSKPMILPTSPTTYLLDSPNWLSWVMSVLAQTMVFAVAVGHDESLLLCFAPAAENLPLKIAICVQSYSMGYSVQDQNTFPSSAHPASTSMPLLVIQGWGKPSLVQRELWEIHAKSEFLSLFDMLCSVDCQTHTSLPYLVGFVYPVMPVEMLMVCCSCFFFFFFYLEFCKH